MPWDELNTAMSSNKHHHWARHEERYTQRGQISSGPLEGSGAAFTRAAGRGMAMDGDSNGGGDGDRGDTHFDPYPVFLDVAAHVKAVAYDFVVQEVGSQIYFGQPTDTTMASGSSLAQMLSHHVQHFPPPGARTWNLRTVVPSDQLMLP